MVLPKRVHGFGRSGLHYLHDSGGLKQFLVALRPCQRPQTRPRPGVKPIVCVKDRAATVRAWASIRGGGAYGIRSPATSAAIRRASQGAVGAGYSTAAPTHNYD